MGKRGRAIIVRAKEVMARGNAGDPAQHAYNAGPGLVGSGGFGPKAMRQYLEDFPTLVLLAEWAVENGAMLPDDEYPRSAA